MPNTTELIRKLKRLAESTNPNEAKNAQRKIEEIMLKEGISSADLESSEEQDWYIWGIHSNFKKRLAVQVVAKVYGVGFKVYGSRDSKKKLIVTCTKSQIVEIKYLLSLYWESWECQLEYLFNAFVHKNQIFGPVQVERSESNYTEETWDKICGLMRFIDATQVHKAIESKS